MTIIKNDMPSLSKSDIDAIASALPLVSLDDSIPDAEAYRDQMAAESALSKLLSHTPNFSYQELRVIHLAIGYALKYISGKCDVNFDVCAIDAEWSSELRKYFFTYNRLFPHFTRLIEKMKFRK